MPDARPIVFETDFGLGNEWVGICHAVMSRIAPGSRIIDLSHLVRPLDVSGGARLLADSLPYLPEDAILIAVVDPNVGADRDIAVQAAGDGRLLVGPDNGLLSAAWSAAGGVSRAFEITSPDVVIEPVAPSLHARDVLCPAAAHLAAGMPIERLGDALEPGGLATLELRNPEVEAGKICCEVIDYNRFGNIQLNVRRPDLEHAGLDGAAIVVEAIAGSVQARQGRTYADFAPGEYGVIFDPRGWLTIVRGNPGNALEDLSLSLGDLVWITRS